MGLHGASMARRAVWCLNGVPLAIPELVLQDGTGIVGLFCVACTVGTPSRGEGVKRGMQDSEAVVGIVNYVVTERVVHWHHAVRTSPAFSFQ